MANLSVYMNYPPKSTRTASQIQCSQNNCAACTPAFELGVDKTCSQLGPQIFGRVHYPLGEWGTVPKRAKLVRVKQQQMWKTSAAPGEACMEGTEVSNFMTSMSLGNTLTRATYCVPPYMGLSGEKTTSCSGNDTAHYSYASTQIGGHSGGTGEALPACVAGAGFHGPIRAQAGGLSIASYELSAGCNNPLLMNRGIEISKPPMLVKHGRQMYIAPLFK